MNPFGVEIELSPLVPPHSWAGFDQEDRVVALGGRGWHFMPPGGLGIVRVKVGQAVWDAIMEDEGMVPFKVGDRVVCVNAALEPRIADCYSERLVEGNVYTIREVYPARTGEDTDYKVGIMLKEIIGRPAFHPGKSWDGLEMGWKSWRFRPLISDSALDQFRVLIKKPVEA